MNVDRVADAGAQEGPGHLAVEGPEPEGRAFRQPPFQFNRHQIDAHDLRLALGQRRRQISRVAGDVGDRQRLRRRHGRDQELAFHAREPMAGNAAEINEVAGFAGAKGDGRARTLAGDARRFHVQIREDDIVLGALAVDQGHLDHLALGGGEHRVGFAFDRTALADEDHAAFSDAGAQGVFDIRKHVDRRLTGRRRLRRLSRGRSFVRRGRRRSGRRRTPGRPEQRDDVVAIMRRLKARERHAVARNGLLRVAQIGVERLAAPGDVGVLHRIRIGEARRAARFPADDPGEARTYQVLAGIERMAGLALAEYLTAHDRVACRRGSGRLGRGVRGRGRVLRHLHRGGGTRRCLLRPARRIFGGLLRGGGGRGRDGWRDPGRRCWGRRSRRLNGRVIHDTATRRMGREHDDHCDRREYRQHRKHIAHVFLRRDLRQRRAATNVEGGALDQRRLRNSARGAQHLPTERKQAGVQIGRAPAATRSCVSGRK